MTASKKILLAAVIVLAGYGLATLVGTRPSVDLPWRPHASDRPHYPAIAALQPSENPATPQPRVNVGARLIPDTHSTTTAEQPIHDVPLAIAAPQLPDSSFELTGVAPPPWIDAITPVSPAQRRVSAPLQPRARLRNEAPRALAVESSSPTVVRSVKPAAAASLEPAQTIHLLSAPSETITDSASLQFAADGSPSAPAVSASLQTAIGPPPGNDMIAPPPFPPANESEEPRRHIIVDGDSLAKLAGRYLDDPHRAEEIFELNRHLLSDPELLPIGAEIDLPPRGSSATRWGEWPQSCMPPGVAIHSAARGGLVPVRPIPSSPSVMPRAQLSGPQPVE